MRLAPIASLAGLLALLAVPAALADGRAPDDERTRAKFEKKKRDVLHEAGERHLELGLWCRDRGLTTQSAAEIIRAKEISEGTHYGASTVLGIMRSYDEAFWKKRKKGSAASRRSYEVKAAKARKKDQTEFLKLYEWAWDEGLEEDAYTGLEKLVREQDAPLEFDDDGRIELEFGVVPSGASLRMRESAITINGRLYLRDAFLAALPELDAIHEIDEGGLRVRSATERGWVEDLHRLGLALVPHLEEALNASSARKLDLFVFATRENYEAWLTAADEEDRHVTDGLAHGASFTALVCAEGGDYQRAASIALHELTHLFWMGCSPSFMPSWFDEGLAETFGGAGTFEWDGETLEVGRMLADPTLARLKDPEFRLSLRELLAGDSLAMIQAGDGRKFYSEAWAFYRYLSEHADGDVTKRFDTWITMCTGSAAGAGTRRNAKPAEDLFRATFARDLDELEAGFFAWLETL